MALNPKELSTLLSIISEECTEIQTLENIIIQIHRYFNKSDHFKISCALVMLLQQPDLLPLATQRLTAVTLLYDMYRNENINTCPFLSVFIHLLHPPDELAKGTQKKLEFGGQLPRITIQEKILLGQLLNGGGKEIDSRAKCSKENCRIYSHRK